MGSDPAAAFPPDDDESPRHLVQIEPFRLARTPVSNSQFRAFVEATGRQSPGHPAPPGEDAVPVTYVDLEGARAFCAWAGVRLPTEAEWEAAARGGDDRLWPWGDEPPDSSHAVFAAGIGSPQAAGGLPCGGSAQGVLDLAGNVLEWVASPYRAYPVEEGAPQQSGEPNVVRGGSFVDGANELRCSFRQPMLPGTRDHYIGFRVAATDLEPQLELEWTEIPGGEVAIGRDPVAFGGPARADELPRHVIELPAFELSLAPVTNGQYAAFVRDGGAELPAHWGGGLPPPELDNHPVTFVDWFAARAFCAWAGGRLPTEAEWEKGARGTDGRNRSLAAVGTGLKRGSTARVGAHARGASPYGLLDMAGNVWEWVSSGYAPYPYDPGDGRENASGPVERVLRGGSFASPDLSYARCAMRSRSRPSRRQAHIGFRVARGASA
jgi:formylglycine-generating enzyme required for sulfatase activity